MPDTAGVEHRRIYDMRHTFATWSLAAGMSIFTLARRMGTSVQMTDATYGHLADGRASGPENAKTPRFAGPSEERAREDSNL